MCYQIIFFSHFKHDLNSHPRLLLVLVQEALSNFHFGAFTSLFRDLLQIFLQFTQVLFQILTATNIEELLFITGYLLLLLP